MIPTPLIRLGIGLGAILALLLALHLYGNARYRAGVKDTDAAWHAAEEAMLARAAGAATAADRQAAANAANYAGQVAKEKEAINEAVDNGTSPLDGLFPAEGR
jgi:hypothetical protein